MAVIRLGGFGGEIRGLHPKLLPETVGRVSRNQKPGKGDLRPWRAPLTVASVPAGRQTIYRMGRDVNREDEYWLSWTGVVHAVLGFDVDDTTERTYYTGDGSPKVTDNTIALASTPYPTANRPLGLPAPAGSLNVITDAGTWAGNVETYVYTYTFVNDWGWESAPAPPSSTSRPSDATATIGNFSAAPPGNYGIDRIRVYRTQTASSGVTDYFFLQEIAYGTASFQDAGQTLGEVLATTDWIEPPADLSHLTSLWAGMLAGISGNAVRFCEPYAPYAWPLAYDAIPPDSKPVALGVFGQSCLVLTTGKPLLLMGSTPDSMDPAPVEMPQACVAPRSVASMGAGVAWASEDGLCWYGSGGGKIVTAGIMNRDDWQALVPSSIRGSFYEGIYWGSYDDGSGRKGFTIDPINPTGMYFLDTGYETTYFDPLRDQLYVRDVDSVKRWDAGTSMLCRFVSKTFRLPRPANFACAEVIADAYPVTFRVYGDGVLRHSQSVTTRDPFRLPSGFMCSDWEIEIETSQPVQMIAMATSMMELAAV